MAKAQVYNYYCDMSKAKTPKENLVPLKIGEGRKAPTYDLSKEIAAQLQAGLIGTKPFKLVYLDGTDVEFPEPEPVLSTEPEPAPATEQPDTTQ